MPRRRGMPGSPGAKVGSVLVAATMVFSGAMIGVPAAVAAPPPGQDFNVSQGDLEFIIKQIEISEAHAEDEVTNEEASPLCKSTATFDIPSQTHFDLDGDPCIGSPLLPFGLRTVDGRWNNLMPGQDGYGTAQEVFPRLLDAEYQDAEATPPRAPGNATDEPGAQTSYTQTDGFVYDSEPRIISNLIVDQTVANKAAGEVAARVDGAGKEGGGTAQRLFGPSSVATSAAISAANFPTDVSTVVIARVNHFADALTVSALAKSAGAPVLLINTNSIPEVSAAELTRLSPENIIIAGGPLAISEAVATELGTYASGTVSRIAGASSVATAVEISKYTHPDPVSDAPVNTVYIATGQSFQDALAVAAPAARDNAPVLLVSRDSIPEVVQTELARLNPAKVVVLGGPLAVSAAVESTLAASWTTERIGGANSIETATMISAAHFTPPVPVVYLTTNANYPDALSAASVAGSQGAPILLVPRGGTLPAVVQAEIDRLQPTNIVILGGNLAVATTLDDLVSPLAGGSNYMIPDIATDEGLSASATSLFTIFGQFFDHGLDLVSKGGNGTVVVPLQPDDPLYVEGARTNFLTLTRATIDDTGGQREHINRTTPFVDQNQTYGSHASHNAFMREYELVNDSPVPTGRILNGEGGEGLPTWKNVKDQARDILGIAMDDFDVLDVPLLYTDPYGGLILDTNGQAQLAFPDGMQSGDRSAPLSTEGSHTANASFLDDIAHGATPLLVDNPTDPDGPQIPGYDNVSLESHYITGDGRGNENIGLTSVHHVFHSEHNRVTEQIRDELENNLPAELLERFQKDGFWNYGERLFQAGRFMTEMQYQHLVFEEFARRIAPSIDPTVLNENSYQPGTNASIRAEFAHAVYRFGHSMLRETVPREHNGVMVETPLLDAFLNPTAFATAPDGTPLTADESAGGILKGLANQTANGVDEFVTDTLRNQLLGLPLDLPTINMARARDTGVPSMQTARETFFNESGDSQLEPYASWEDFRLSMKNPESISNFLAAYSTHESVTGAATLVDKRAAGTALAADPAYMALPAADTGLNDVDLWMGGLAEKPYIFGGMLGSTFNYVFEAQLEDLQNGDRFYYLTRNLGNTLFHSLEANSLSQLVIRNTTADKVPHDVFAAPQLTFNLSDTQENLNAAGLTGSAADGWRFTGPEHIVVQDTDEASSIRGGLGDDSVWGRGGNDRIEGDDGVDALMGGDGDDIITDLFGDGDRLQGEAGHDVLNPGPGVADLTFGGSGIDFMLGGQDRVTAHGGLGNDFLLGSTGSDVLYGDEGNDWIQGNGGNGDLLQGDMGNTMFNDPNLYHGGHDIIIGGAGNNDFDAEGGDDIMVAGGATDRYSGVLGFDWVSYRGHKTPVNADMGFVVGMPQSITGIRDRFLQTEATSGWSGDDILRGSQGGVDLTFDPAGGAIGYGHHLTQDHLDRIDGLREMLGGGDVPEYARPFLVDDPTVYDGDHNNNILIGGTGSDLIEPRDGRNFVDGDAWLNVRVEYRPEGGAVESQDSIAAFSTRMLNGTINPSELHMVREVVQLDNEADNIDTVVFEGIEADYTVTELEANVVKVVNALEGEEMASVLRNIERIQFNDTVVCLPVDTEATCGQAAGEVVLGHDDPITENGEVTTDASGVSDVDDIESDLTFSLQTFVEAGVDAQSDVWVTTQTNESGTFTLTDAEVGAPVRVLVTYIDGNGTHEQIASAGTDAVANVNDEPVGPVISPEAASVGDTLSIVTQMSDEDGAESVLEEPGGVYIWQQSANGTDNWSNIDGATGDGTDMASFTVTARQQNQFVRLSIGYDDDQGTAEVAYSNATALIPSPQNLAPDPLPAE